MKTPAKVLLAALATAALGGVLYAAPGDGTGTPATGEGSGSAAARPLSPEQMKTELTQRITDSTNDARAVKRLQIAARTEQNALKLTCINDKFIQIKGLQNLIDGTISEFKTALDDGDQMAMTAAYGTGVEHTNEIRTLKEAAMACLGEVRSTDGDGDLDVDGPDVADDPTDNNPFDDDANFIEPSVFITPFF